MVLRKNGDDVERDKTIMAIGRSLLAYFREEILEECCMFCSHQCYVMIYYMIAV